MVPYNICPPPRYHITTAPIIYLWPLGVQIKMLQCRAISARWAIMGTGEQSRSICMLNGLGDVTNARGRAPHGPYGAWGGGGGSGCGGFKDSPIQQLGCWRVVDLSLLPTPQTLLIGRGPVSVMYIPSHTYTHNSRPSLFIMHKGQSQVHGKHLHPHMHLMPCA